MVMCGPDCVDACDWCRHFDWDAWKCEISGEETNPGQSCDDFHCSHAE